MIRATPREGTSQEKILSLLAIPETNMIIKTIIIRLNDHHDLLRLITHSYDEIRSLTLGEMAWYGCKNELSNSSSIFYPSENVKIETNNEWNSYYYDGKFVAMESLIPKGKGLAMIEYLYQDFDLYDETDILIKPYHPFGKDFEKTKL